MWQCRRQSRSEHGELDRSYQGEAFYSQAMNMHSYSNLGLQGKTFYYRPRTSSDNTLRIWNVLIGSYCGLQFTYESDRVPALAGITRWFQKRYNLIPILGCWKELLVKQLSWEIHRSKMDTEPSFRKSNNLPSWTWLSQAWKELKFADSRYAVECISIRQISLKWEGEELTSNLIDSQLIVNGIIFQTQFTFFEKHGRFLSYVGATDSDLRFLKANPGFKGGSCVFDEADHLTAEHPVLWCTCLLLSITSNQGSITFRYLVLEEISSDTPEIAKRYKRTGCGGWRIQCAEAIFDDNPLIALKQLHDGQSTEHIPSENSYKTVERILAKAPVVLELI
jgi:hypothetical protein